MHIHKVLTKKVVAKFENNYGYNYFSIIIIIIILTIQDDWKIIFDVVGRTSKYTDKYISTDPIIIK